MRLTQDRIEGLGHLLTLIVDGPRWVAAVTDVRRDVGIDLDPALPLPFGSLCPDEGGA